MKTILILTLALLLGALEGIAGGVSEFAIKNDKRIVYHDTLVVTTSIHNQIAVTRTLQAFTNPHAVKSAVRYAVSVPANATVTGITYTINGARKVAKLVSSDTMISGTGNPVSSVRDNLTAITGDLSLVFPFADSALPHTHIDIEVTWVELMSYSAGGYFYEYPTKAIVGRDVDEWTLDATFDVPMTQHAITPTTNEQVLTSTNVTYRQSFTATNTPMKFSCALQLQSGHMDILSCKPGNEDGYALFTTIPEAGATDGSTRLTKRVCLLYDVSGSMQGQKYNQAREAVTFCLSHMSPNDFVSVMAFSSSVIDLSQGAVQATPQNVELLKDKVNRQPITGGTNIMAALTAALAQFNGSSDVNTIIFITDGIASVQFEDIVARNADNVRIYVFGIGSDVNGDALRRISADNRGEVDLITDAGSVASRISTFFDKISVPLLKNPAIAFSPNDVYDICPLNLPDIYAGEQFVFAGRYSTPGPVQVTVDGESTTGHQSTSYNGTLLGDSTTYVFVPKLWARMRINALLDMMSKQTGQTALWKEWRAEIIRLGKTYGIMTPFTTFTSTPADPTDPTDPTDPIDPKDPTDPAATSVYDYPVQSHQVRMYPNPVKGTTTIELTVDVPTDRIVLEIISIDGRVVGRVVLHGSFDGLVRLPIDIQSICTDGISPGSYTLRIIMGNAATVTTFTVVR